MSKQNWISEAVDKMNARGTVGSFSAAAKKAGKSTEAYARQEVNSPTASTAMKRKAQFALNVHK